MHTSRSAIQSGIAPAFGHGALWALACLAVSAAAASAHPHVWVDGGVDFRLSDGATLETLEVTWLYDEFETLYTLSVLGLTLNDKGDLDEADRQHLVQRLSTWPSDFDGSAHLTVDGAAVPLDWPTAPEARMIDGRLELKFRRHLQEPVELSKKAVEVGFYESTYFFAFSVTQSPALLGSADRCATDVRHFTPDPADSELQAALAKLGREETPEIANVGSFFADRIIVTCE